MFGYYYSKFICELCKCDGAKFYAASHTYPGMLRFQLWHTKWHIFNLYTSFRILSYKLLETDTQTNKHRIEVTYNHTWGSTLDQWLHVGVRPAKYKRTFGKAYGCTNSNAPFRIYIYICLYRQIVNKFDYITRCYLVRSHHTCGRTEIRDHEASCEQFMLYAWGALCRGAYPNLSSSTNTLTYNTNTPIHVYIIHRNLHIYMIRYFIFSASKEELKCTS